MKKQLLFICLLTWLVIGKSYPQNSVMWGMTVSGIFKMTNTGDTFALIHPFSQTTGTSAYGNVIRATNNKLYGLTYQGGTNNSGVLFSLDLATEVYTVLVNFDPVSNDHSKGRYPLGSLFQAKNGLLYGMTSTGGTLFAGTIFSFNPSNNQFIKISDFPVDRAGVQPLTPSGNLMQASDGLLYGMTSMGGYNTNNTGVLFSLNPATNTLTYWAFNTGSGPGNPRGSLVQLGSNLYGTTIHGGNCDSGTVFNFNITNHTFNTVMSFCHNKPDYGFFPTGNLTPITAKRPPYQTTFYGMTGEGGLLNGTVDKGNVFTFNTFTPTNTYPLTFNGANGANPGGSLILASDGKLYGMTLDGGAGSAGVAFKLDPSNNEYTKLHDFRGGTTGAYPHGDLLQLQCNTRTPGPINGQTKVCAFSQQTYSIAAVAGATFYTWKIPVSAVIVGASNGTTVKVKFADLIDSVSVKASNGTCMSYSSTLHLTQQHNCRVVGRDDSHISTAPGTSVFPNPNTGTFTLTVNSSKSTTLQINVIDLTGRVIDSKKVSALQGENIYNYTLNKIAQGVYTVTIIGDNTTKDIKLRIE